MAAAWALTSKLKCCTVTTVLVLTPDLLQTEHLLQHTVTLLLLPLEPCSGTVGGRSLPQHALLANHDLGPLGLSEESPSKASLFKLF